MNCLGDPLKMALQLRLAWLEGDLGGEVMPEDASPTLDKGSDKLWHYFTLGMALNYQRNSYELWRSATRVFLSHEEVFCPLEVALMPLEQLRNILVSSRVALQPNKHVQAWQRICLTLSERYEGNIRNVFEACDFDVLQLSELVQSRDRKFFPNLGGTKLFNYWLHVMEVYCEIQWKHREAITIAPDTHVIQSSARLGLIPVEVVGSPVAAPLAAAAWKELLQGSDLLPIDMHTPLWLWSRAGFPDLRSNNT